ncbi:albumin-like [Elgaria multicarinata webbii]|uniref:albumin-like n=1 Tax=Elgaria multicarinata webbii TaxID=159646 RepID=UPI002FCD5212
MKWVTFIFYLFLVSFAKSETPIEREQEFGGAFHTHIAKFSEDFKHIVLGTLAQYVQRATFEEVWTLTNGITELAKKCTEDEQADQACGKPLGIVLTEKLCHEEGLGDKYGFAECCGKVDEERKECLLSHKNATIPPFQKPTAEEACKTFHENTAAFLDHYLYQVARRNPTTTMFTLLGAAQDFEKVFITCCQEADKDSCFNEKAPPIRQKVLETIDLQKQICYIQKKFGKRMITSLQFIQLSQKFPNAAVLTILRLAEDVSHIEEERCKGDTLECFFDRLNLSRFICSHQDEISSKVKVCCEKPILEQRNCLVTLENDEKPEDLSPEAGDFIDNHIVCPRYAEDQNMLLAHFLYENARKHPEFSLQLMLRIGDKYEDLLEKCCKSETPGECFTQWEEEFKKQINNTLERVNNDCEFHKTLGDHLFQKELILIFTKKAPQLLFEELNKFIKKLTEITTKCCGQDDTHRLRCVERNTGLALGAFCQQHEEGPISKRISRCCGDSFAFARDCIMGLGVDEEYVPAPFDPELFTFHADLCPINPDDLKEEEKRLLYNLVRHKPTITSKQFDPIATDFIDLSTKCCKADNRDECFTTEGSKFVERIRTAV